MEKMLVLVGTCARIAAESTSRLNPLLSDEYTLSPELLHWVVDAVSLVSNCAELY